MSGNTSATGGYLPGIPPSPPTDDDYTAALQGLVSGLASLPGNLVRPRWQPMPPVQPSADTTWAAIGITMIEADQYPYLYHTSEPDPGYDTMQRHLTITVMMTFYGPAASAASAAVRDGLYLPQNYEGLRMLGLKLQEVHDLARVPEIINQQFIDRLDLRVDFRAQADRVYPIFNLLGAQVHIQGETETRDVTVYEGTSFDDFATYWDDGMTTWDATI